MIDNTGRQYHLHLKEGDVGRYILLPGDPGRCKAIAAFLEDAVFVAQNREHTTYTGYLLGEKVSVVSTGMGGPSAAIAVEELVKIGADTFIRVGTSGAMQPELHTGDLAVVSAAIRDEGTTRQYLPLEFPAVADPDVVHALAAGARRAGLPYHIGISHSKDSFYGEVEPQRMPLSAQLAERWKAWTAGGAICSEMEAAAIFILCSIYRKRAGGVMVMLNSQEDLSEEEQQRLFSSERAVRAAVEGIRILIEEDRQRSQS